MSKTCLGSVLAALLLSGCTERSDSAPAGDFAMLAQAEPGYRQAQPGVPLRFPDDHGAHPEFRIEWWYLTANLTDPSGRSFGVQWTLFRTATRPPGELPAGECQPGARRSGVCQSGEGASGELWPPNPWQDPQVYMAHFAITTPDSHRAFQRYARGGGHEAPGRPPLARAGATAAPFAAWLDDWSLRSAGGPWLPLELDARQGAHAVRLRLSGERAPVPQGEGGFSQKHADGGGSHYYSQPFLAAEGELQVDGTAIPVTGVAWLDHEWSSQFLQPDQAGWDWLALHLDSGEKLMLFRLRDREDETRSYRHGVLIGPAGETVRLDPARIGFEPLGMTRIAGRELPLRWRIRLPEIGRELMVEALHPRQWMDVDFAYWEGVVTASGADPGERGRGYLELTGYPVQ